MCGCRGGGLGQLGVMVRVLSVENPQTTLYVDMLFYKTNLLKFILYISFTSLACYYITLACLVILLNSQIGYIYILGITGDDLDILEGFMEPLIKPLHHSYSP